MKEFEALIGEWHAEGEIPLEPPMKVSQEAKIKRLGEFIVFSSSGTATSRLQQRLLACCVTQ